MPKQPGRFHWPRTLLHVVLFFCTSLGLLLLLVTSTPLVSWWATALAGPGRDPSGEVLIVLGGSVLENGAMGWSSYLRGMYAVQAWRNGGLHQVVLVGAGSEKISAAEAMRDFLECHGVPREAIRLETRSNSTRENALNAKELLAGTPGRFVLLTSDYHMFRAYRVFKRNGLEVLPRPFPDARERATKWRGRWPVFLELVVETAKISFYYVRGWI